MNEKPRTTISVNREIATRLSSLAKREKGTRYGLANTILESILRIYEGGGELSQVFSSWKAMQISRELGSFPLLPRTLIERMVQKISATDKDWLPKAWYDEGEIVGRVFKFHVPRVEDLGDEVMRALPSFARKLELREIEGAEPKHYELRLVGDFSEELAKCLEQFMRGGLTAYSLTVVESSVSRNLVHLVMVSRGRGRHRRIPNGYTY